MTRLSGDQPVALVTGVGRSIGIGAAIASELAADGWRVVTVGWRAYDDRMPWGSDAAPLAHIEADLADAEVPARLFERVGREFGPVSALVCCHCESVDSAIGDTSVESFDRHIAVNARSVWLLIKSFADQLAADGSTPRRIIAITSDHTAFNLPYGASKGAMDRIVLASAVELAHLGVTANVVNPGATDTGWMDDSTRDAVMRGNLQPQLGLPSDCANLVRFLCSADGQWINGQLLHSDGGLRP